MDCAGGVTTGGVATGGAAAAGTPATTVFAALSFGVIAGLGNVPAMTGFCVGVPRPFDVVSTRPKNPASALVASH